jgi:hypothetical protein
MIQIQEGIKIIQSWKVLQTGIQRPDAAKLSLRSQLAVVLKRHDMASKEAVISRKSIESLRITKNLLR